MRLSVPSESKTALLSFSLVALSVLSMPSAISKPEMKMSPEPIHPPGYIEPPTPKPVATGIGFNASKIAKYYRVETVPADPYAADGDIQLSGEPIHTRLIFDGKKVESDNDFTQKHLLVYPIKKWEQMFPADRKALFNKRIGDLKKMIATKSGAGLAHYPTLPDSDGAERLHAKVKPLSFANGSGVSFIACYGNGDPAYDADSFFYTFQGITTDGKKYVSFYWPIKVTGMKPNMPQKQAENFIEKLPRANFSPSLEDLDKAVSSLTVGAFIAK